MSNTLRSRKAQPSVKRDYIDNRSSGDETTLLLEEDVVEQDDPNLLSTQVSPAPTFLEKMFESLHLSSSPGCFCKLLQSDLGRHFLDLLEALRTIRGPMPVTGLIGLFRRYGLVLSMGRCQIRNEKGVLVMMVCEMCPRKAEDQRIYVHRLRLSDESQNRYHVENEYYVYKRKPRNFKPLDDLLGVNSKQYLLADANILRTTPLGTVVLFLVSLAIAFCFDIYLQCTNVS